MNIYLQTIILILILLPSYVSAKEINSLDLNTVNTKYLAANNHMTNSNSKVENNYLLKIEVGGHSFLATFVDNNATKKLITILSKESKSLSASNYGGFEKIVNLGTSLPTNDHHVNTKSGDIMLYQGNKLVIFYASNSWSYTPIGKIIDFNQKDLESALNGNDSKVTLSIVNKNN